jgi:hypothetical protein
MRATEVETQATVRPAEHPAPFAFALLVAGLVLAATIVVLIAVAIYDAEALPLIAFVRGHVGNGHNIIDAAIGGRSVRIRGSYEFGYVFAVSVYASLLFALATISRALIENGVRLMNRAR